MTFLRRRPAVARTPRQHAGDAAEQAACDHLVAHGCRIVARNVRYREGELDIVARHEELWLFVEVRLRASERFGGAGASVDRAKRQRVVRAAQHYLLTTHGQGTGGWPPCRFDVVTVDGQAAVQWIQDAFTAEES